MSVQLRLSPRTAKLGNRMGSGSTSSGWFREALDAEESPLDVEPLTGVTKCDFLVIGGGFTGLWTALELASHAPGARIHLVEAGLCGSGASGANGGGLMNLWPKFLSLRALMTTDEAVWHGRESERAVTEVREFITKRQVDVGLTPGPWLWAATSPSQRDAWVETIEALEAAGVAPIKVISSDEARGLCGADTHLGGALDPSFATLQPALLARELRRAALEAGVRIYENTPIEVLEHEVGAREGIVAKASTGQVRAKRAVLAVNAWAAALENLGRLLVMVASDTLITEPVPELLHELGWTNGTGVSDSRRRLNYYHTTPDGRVVFGKGGMAIGYGAGAATRMWGRPAIGELRSQLARTFPRLADVGVAAAWRAPVEYSVTSLPFAGWLETIPGVAYVTGYSGIGVGPSKLMARIVASLVMGRDDEYASSALARPPASTLPREPLRFLGAQLALWALGRAERADDQDRETSAIVKRLAAVDPTSFVG